MKRWYLVLRGFFKQMNRQNINAYASSAAFFLFLSLIPMIILLCSLLPFTPLKKSDIMSAVSVMPTPIVPLLIALIDSLYESTVGVISVAAAVTAWSASKGMLALMRGLNAVNGVVEKRGYLMQRIIATFYTLIMLVLLLVYLVLMVKPVYSWIFLTFAFILIYTWVPECKMKLKKQIPGAVFAAVSWNLFSYAFSIYIEHFNGLSIYGSLSAIVVIMLWLYFCMYLLLAGAHINHFLGLFLRQILKK